MKTVNIFILVSIFLSCNSNKSEADSIIEKAFLKNSETCIFFNGEWRATLKNIQTAKNVLLVPDSIRSEHWIFKCLDRVEGQHSDKILLSFKGHESIIPTSMPIIGELSGNTIRYVFEGHSSLYQLSLKKTEINIDGVLQIKSKLAIQNEEPFEILITLSRD